MAVRVSPEVVARYAGTLFELAQEGKALDQVEADARSMLGAFKTSDELANALGSPLYAGEDKAKALAAIGKKLKVSDLMIRFLGVLAQNGRASAAKPVLTELLTMAAKARGAVIAEVATAQTLSDAQTKDLKAALERAFNAPVDIEPAVKPELIGGLVVKVGSRLFDDSIKSKLDALKLAMKGA